MTDVREVVDFIAMLSKGISDGWSFPIHFVFHIHFFCVVVVFLLLLLFGSSFLGPWIFPCAIPPR